MDPVVELANPQQSMSIMHLISQATPLVKAVMALLMLASVVSWAVIFQKWNVIRRARAEADNFEHAFMSGGDLNKLYIESRGRNSDDSTGL